MKTTIYDDRDDISKLLLHMIVECYPGRRTKNYTHDQNVFMFHLTIVWNDFFENTLQDVLHNMLELYQFRDYHWVLIKYFEYLTMMENKYAFV